MLYPLMTGSIGINNKVDKPNLLYQEGIIELAYAMNCDVEVPFRVCSRKGYTQQSSLPDCHSFYYPDVGIYAYFISQNGLFRLDNGNHAQQLTVVTPKVKMWWTLAGDAVIYANGVGDQGAIQNGAVVPWQRPSGQPSPPDYPPSNRAWDDPPVGKYLATYNGRVLIASGNDVYASEPWWYSYFDLDSNRFPFSSPVNMIANVVGGVYMADQEGVVWCPEKRVHDQIDTLQLDNILLPPEYGPVIEGTVTPCDGSLISEQFHGKGILWVSKHQVCYAGPGGHYFDLSSKRLVLPGEITRGSGLVYKNKYYFNLW